MLDEEKFDKEVKLYGVQLSLSGKELLKVITIEETPERYVKALEEYLAAGHLQLKEVGANI